MDADVPLSLILIRFLLFSVSFTARCLFAGSETAFLSVDKWAVEGLAASGDRRARVLLSLARDSRNTISALLIGTNICTVLASVMGASIASLLGAGEIVTMAVVPLAITGLLFFFSELVPKTYSASMPSEIALTIAPTLSVLVAVFRPVSVVLSAVPNLFASMLGERKDSPLPSSDEPVRAALDLAAEEGQVGKEDGEVITGVLDSSDTRVRDIMVPLDKVTTLDPRTPVREALAAFRMHRFSRVPVALRDSGDVPGVVYMKDIVREAMKAGGCRTPVRTLMRPPFLASPSENLLDVLARMRKNRVHFAVVSEDGRPIGIVTMEDILTEIVGDTGASNTSGDAPQSPDTSPLVARSDDGMAEGDALEFAGEMGLNPPD